MQIGDPPPPGGKPVGLRPKETDHVLIDQTAGMASKRFSDLHFAATGRQVRDGAYPLHMAAAAKAPAPVIEMLVRGADSVLTKTNKRGETPLHVALRTAGVDEEVVETLVRCGPGALRVRDGGHGNLPIHAAMAAAECSVRVAKALLETWPGSVHERNAAGLTPLELALRHGKCSDEVLRLVEISDRAT
jgi:ankyrin repeat protein